MANDTKMGRKPKDTPEVREKILDAIRNGDTYDMACKQAGIGRTAFYEWLNAKEDFANAVKMARAEFEQWELNGILADAKKSLKVLICGQEYDETKVEYEQDPRDPSKPRVKRQTTTHKKILPNATAVIFALCNRDPEHWQNRVTQDVNGKIDVEDKPNISLRNVPDDLLAQVIEAINGK